MTELETGRHPGAVHQLADTSLHRAEGEPELVADLRTTVQGINSLEVRMFASRDIRVGARQ